MLVVPGNVGQKLSPYVKYGVKLRSKRHDEIKTKASEGARFHERSGYLPKIDTLSQIERNVHIGMLITSTASKEIDSLDSLAKLEKAPQSTQS